MSRSQAIAPHLPFLRRYARALTGSQDSGDAFVAAALEAVLADPAALPDDPSPRVALYRVFHVIWSSANVAEPDAGDGVGQEDRAVSEERAAQVRLQRLVPERRQALLLTTLEGFSAEDAGRVLGRPADQVVALISEAMGDITRGIRTEVLIIEDETVIALDLAAIVQEMGHTVSHIAVTRSDAVAAALQKRPGLILADIQLADDSSGIDAVKEILSDGRIPAIFITAYPERLLTGERPEPTYLVTKPFEPDTLKVTISQALSFFGQPRQSKQAV